MLKKGILFFKVLVLWAANPSWTHPALYQQFNASVIGWCVSTGGSFLCTLWISQYQPSII